MKYFQVSNRNSSVIVNAANAAMASAIVDGRPGFKRVAANYSVRASPVEYPDLCPFPGDVFPLQGRGILATKHERMTRGVNYRAFGSGERDARAGRAARSDFSALIDPDGFRTLYLAGYASVSAARGSR